MPNKLEQLHSMTVVVADTGDLEAVRRLKPQDCTTNPSLVLKAMQNPAMSEIFRRAIAKNVSSASATSKIVQELTVGLGAELAMIVPGRVSIEVDAKLSFDTEGSIAKAHALVEAFDRLGIGRERLLIKLASTWEGIRAAAKLQSEGIDCNLTLLFSLAQAKACADAGVFLISPFVGRITDWYTKSTGQTYAAENDPGVLSVKRIYDYYKSSGISTVVMGASFRNVGQIEELAGCDRLTISPELLTKLCEDEGQLSRRLQPQNAASAADPVAEGQFRWDMNEDAMATEKLAEGIRNFHADAVRLEQIIAEQLER